MVDSFLLPTVVERDNPSQNPDQPNSNKSDFDQINRDWTAERRRSWSANANEKRITGISHPMNMEIQREVSFSSPWKTQKLKDSQTSLFHSMLSFSLPSSERTVCFPTITRVHEQREKKDDHVDLLFHFPVKMRVFRTNFDGNVCSVEI